ncbi:MAG: family 10 glycosylhydrolase [Prevotellaceae bacterium]|nr:family 10 glycosylhydrolase [Prevotellaceae bacterium]
MPPKHEVRAMWLTTIGGLDWPHSYANNTQTSINKQKKELIGILDKLQQAGINTILLQTRVRATTIYPSKYEPWDGCLSGKPGISPGYDALQFAIDECHKRGMELHAWVVTIPVGKWNGKGCSSLRGKYPKLIKKIGDDGFMNPEDPQTGTYIANICEEITRNYDIDGIHLDYIRYPEDWKIKVSKSQGRNYITDIVRKINLKVKTLKPWVKMSCSPIGKADDLPRMSSRGWNAYSRVCQDAQGWLRDGLMDQLYPMMYFKDNNFYPFALDWKERSYGRMVVPGLGIYFMSPKEKNWKLNDITREMEVLRQWGLGHCYFRSKFFTDNTKGIFDFAAKEFDNTPSLVPPMTWASNVSPLAPTTLSTDSVNNTISWSGAQDRCNGPYLTYNIYSSYECPVDINDPRNLMMQRIRNTSIQVPLNGRYYAVTAMDRYGNESEPKQNHSIPVRHRQSGKSLTIDEKHLFKCDGKVLYLGKTGINRRDIISIETLQGQSVATAFVSEMVDVRKLPEGIYVIRSLGKKKASHRLGYFMIERRSWR